MKEFRLKVSVKNNRLLKRREKLNFSQEEMAKQIGITQTQYSLYECLRKSPLDKKGEWKETAQNIASFFGCTEETLWPQAILKFKKSAIEYEVGFAELGFHERAVIESPEDFLLKQEKLKAVDTVLNSISDREKEVLLKSFGFDGEELSHHRIASSLGAEFRFHSNGSPLTGSAIQIIEGKALRKLRHPRNVSVLKGFRSGNTFADLEAERLQRVRAGLRLFEVSHCLNPAYYEGYYSDYQTLQIWAKNQNEAKEYAIEQLGSLKQRRIIQFITELKLEN